MVVAELRARLQAGSFRPFKMKMNDGTVVEVRHRELARIAHNGVVYVYEPIEESDDPVDVAGLPRAYAIHNICAIEPLPTRVA